MSELDINYYPDDTYIIEEHDYGYGYCRVTFLDITEALSSEDMWAIMEKFRSVLQEHLDGREA